MRWRARVALAGLATLAAACTSPPPGPGVYRPDRRDYATFRAAWPDVLEPNYLPFLVHRFPENEAMDVLVLCRWDDDAMPIPVHVRPPAIPDALQDEFSPRDPAGFVTAAEHALATWERELAGLVRFRLVGPAEARLTIVLVGEQAPAPGPDVKVLGVTRLARACRVDGLYPDADRMRVRFEVPELTVYVADEFGLLHQDQVEWITLHEIGHALGMRGHSPIPADLMYEIVRDRVILTEGLSTEDVNTFVSLYELPNGAVYGRMPREGTPPREPGLAPTGPARLARAPYVDPRLGFTLQPPAGWMRVDTGQGMVAVDGTTWDYTASFQVVVQRFPSIEAYVERYGAHYRQRGRLLRSENLVVNGRRAVQVLLASREVHRLEEVTLIESGDGRVLVVIADAPADQYEAFAPWFEASLGSLQIWDFPEGPALLRRR